MRKTLLALPFLSLSILAIGCESAKLYLTETTCHLKDEGKVIRADRRGAVGLGYYEINKILNVIEKGGYKLAEFAGNPEIINKRKKRADYLLSKDDLCWNLELDRNVGQLNRFVTAKAKYEGKKLHYEGSNQKLLKSTTFREFFIAFSESAKSLQSSVQKKYSEYLAQKENKRKKINLKMATAREKTLKQFKKSGFKNVEFENINDVMSSLVEGKRNVEQTKNIVFLTNNSKYYVLQVLDDIVLFKHRYDDKVFILKKNKNDQTFLENMKIENINNSYVVFLGTTKYNNALGVSKQVFLFEYAYLKKGV